MPRVDFVAADFVATLFPAAWRSPLLFPCGAAPDRCRVFPTPAFVDLGFPPRLSDERPDSLVRRGFTDRRRCPDLCSKTCDLALAGVADLTELGSSERFAVLAD